MQIVANKKFRCSLLVSPQPCPTCGTTHATVDGQHCPLRVDEPAAPSTSLACSSSSASVGRSLHPSASSSASSAGVSPVRQSLRDNLAQFGQLEQVFDPTERATQCRILAFIKSIRLADTWAGRRDLVLPPLAKGPRPTLVLDMDETLVHCSENCSDIPNPDFTFEVMVSGTTYTLWGMKRPGLEEFWEHVKGRFEVVIYTASQREYADPILDILDPSHDRIHHRLYREDCVQVAGYFVKDLESLGRDMAHTVLVDNSPSVFALQLDNGIPILSWRCLPDDRELFKICHLLDDLATA
eukprot:RCo053097